MSDLQEYVPCALHGSAPHSDARAVKALPVRKVRQEVHAGRQPELAQGHRRMRSTPQVEEWPNESVHPSVETDEGRVRT